MLFRSIKFVKTSVAVSYDSQSQTLSVGGKAVGGMLKIYSTDGRLLSSRQITATATSLADVKQPVFIIRVEGMKFAPRVIKIRK